MIAVCCILCLRQVTILLEGQGHVNIAFAGIFVLHSGGSRGGLGGGKVWGPCFDWPVKILHHVTIRLLNDSKHFNAESFFFQCFIWNK